MEPVAGSEQDPEGWLPCHVALVALTPPAPTLSLLSLLLHTGLFLPEWLLEPRGCIHEPWPLEAHSRQLCPHVKNSALPGTERKTQGTFQLVQLMSCAHPLTSQCFCSAHGKGGEAALPEPLLTVSCQDLFSVSTSVTDPSVHAMGL